jgi:hypothetical protein
LLWPKAFCANPHADIPSIAIMIAARFMLSPWYMLPDSSLHASNLRNRDPPFPL